MTTYLLHGFNVADGGKNTIARLQPYLPGTEVLHAYGWVGLIRLRCVNARTVQELEREVQPGDVVIGHSNGCLIAWELSRRVHLGAVVCINPALRRDTLWSSDTPVLCLHNSTDWVVQLGRWWGRLTSLGGIRPHGWGAAGQYGFTEEQENVTNLDTAAPYWPHPVKGHSGVFKDPEALAYWGQIIARWLASVRKT